MRISDWSSDVCSSDLERDAGKAHRDLRIADAADQEAGAAGIVVGARHADLVGQRRDFVEEGRQFDRLRAIVERRHKFDRFADVRKIGSRSEEHTSELQSLMRISYAVFCLKKKKK